MKLLLLIDTYWTAAVLQAGYEKEYLKTAPPQCLQWKVVESKLSMNKWERHRGEKREELSWDPSEHHRCQGAQRLRKRGEGRSGPKALKKMIKQVFKEQPEVWADSIGDERVKGSASGFWDHVWPLHTLHPISSVLLDAFIVVLCQLYHLQVFRRLERHCIRLGMSIQWCSCVVGFCLLVFAF